MPAAQAFEWLEVMMAIRLPGVPPMAQASEPRVILWLIVRPWHHAEVPICADLRPGLELLIVWPSDASYPFYRRAGFKGCDDPLQLVLNADNG